MLVLTLRLNDIVYINKDIAIKNLPRKYGKTRIGIVAPQCIKVSRKSIIPEADLDKYIPVKDGDDK